MKKKPVIIALISVVSIAVAVLLFFFIRGVVANVRIQNIANEKGEAFGITDFKSKSTNFIGEVWDVELKSESFYQLSDEDRFQIILSIVTDEELKSMMVSAVRSKPGPLVSENFEIYSGNAWHYFDINADYNKIYLTGGEEKYCVNNAESYGFILPFKNKYGTEDTTCIVSDCNNKIVRTGNSNACIDHCEICDDCYIYIDKGDTRCDNCAKKAFEKHYDDVAEVLGDPW
ncbi:MAG: hypothetical protein J6Q94_09025 [Clostridia bacterium]|nr:hypothetical protein [Clostridia bacterium]